ncbi:unnamed protein product, partial [Prorocentrum cordatum]
LAHPLAAEDEALAELRGTSLDGDGVADEAAGGRLELWRGERQARRLFEGRVLPLLRGLGAGWWPDTSFRLFQRAAGAVLSRGFCIGGRGPFLVPFADMLNHAPPGDGHTRLEGDP